MRVLLVDDEDLALQRMAKLLAQVEDVMVVGAIVDSLTAVGTIKRERPDLVLLDIEMPKMDGFDVVEALMCSGTGARPLIGFVTAFPQFALDAFDCGAIDFICKPVRLTRLRKTIERARSALAAKDAKRRLDELRSNLADLREATAHVAERNLWVRSRGEMLRIRTHDVIWIEAQSCYVSLHLDQGSHLVRSTLASMAEQLGDEGFIRVHKSALVNRAKVVRVKSKSAQTKLTMEDGTEISVGRKYRDSIRDFSVR